MKKCLILAAVATLTLASCTKTIHKAHTTDRDVPIGFNTAVGVPTKSAITSALYPTDGTFKVWALYSSESFADLDALTTGAADATKTAVFIPGVAASHTGTNPNDYWTTSTAYYWPKAGYLNFWAVSPSGFAATVSWTAGTITGPSDYAVTATNDVANDVLFSAISANKQESNYTSGMPYDETSNDAGSYQGVDIKFYHALSLVDFQVKYGTINGNETLKVTNISLIKPQTVGQLTVTPTGFDSFAAGDGTVAWSSVLATTDVLVGNSEQTLTDTYASYGSSVLVKPQTFTNGGNALISVTVTSTIGGVVATTTHTINLYNATPDHVWAWGKHYTYKLNVTERQIIFDPYVTDWTSVAPDEITL